MAEETTQVQDEATQEEVIDWEAKYKEMRQHSRDWEAKARANQSAAEELEKLKAEQMTEQEKAIARAEAAESKLAQLEAEKAHAAAARKIADASGVPLSLLEFCTDEAAMEQFAAAYKDSQPETTVHAAARADGSRTIRNDGEKRTAKEAFMQFAAEQLNH